MLPEFPLILCINKQQSCPGTHLLHLKPLCEQVKQLLCALNKKPRSHIKVGEVCSHNLERHTLYVRQRSSTGSYLLSCCHVGVLFELHLMRLRIILFSMNLFKVGWCFGEFIFSFQPGKNSRSSPHLTCLPFPCYLLYRDRSQRGLYLAPSCRVPAVRPTL